jgi:hypothetical protein
MSSNLLGTCTFFFSVGLCAVAKMDISENPEDHARHVGRHSVVDHNHRPQPAPAVTPGLNYSAPSVNSAGDEGMTPRSSIFAYPDPAKEEARSKDTRSPQGPTLRLGVEGKNYL